MINFGIGKKKSLNIAKGRGHLSRYSSGYFCRGVKQGKRLSEFLVKRTEFKTKTMHTSHYITILQCCYKLYIGETGRRLGDWFREHFRDVELNDENTSKYVARHFNLPKHSKQHMTVCGLSLHLDNSESRKTLEQKFIFQIGTLNPHGITERFSFS